MSGFSQNGLQHSTDISSDYATWLNMEENITSNAMICDYNMVWIVSWPISVSFTDRAARSTRTTSCPS